MQEAERRREHLEEILREHVRNAKRSEELGNRLYGIDGKIYELEDIINPRAGRRAELEALKKQRGDLEEKQGGLDEKIGEGDALILKLLHLMRNQSRAEVLQLLFVERLEAEDVAAKIYGRGDARSVSAMYHHRRRALEELAELPETVAAFRL